MAHWPHLELMPCSLPKASFLRGVAPPTPPTAGRKELSLHLGIPCWASLRRGLGPISPQAPSPATSTWPPACFSVHLPTQRAWVLWLASAAEVGREESSEKLFRKAWAKAGATQVMGAGPPGPRPRTTVKGYC